MPPPWPLGGVGQPNQIMPFSMGYVKGMARAVTLLAVLRFLQLDGCATLTTGFPALGFKSGLLLRWLSKLPLPQACTSCNILHVQAFTGMSTGFRS